MWPFPNQAILTCPGSRRYFPPPTMSVMSGNVPRAMVSTVVPTASPTARPRRLPLKRSFSSMGAAMSLAVGAKVDKGFPTFYIAQPRAQN